jgi:hypothetical protein
MPLIDNAKKPACQKDPNTTYLEDYCESIVDDYRDLIETNIPKPKGPKKKKGKGAVAHEKGPYFIRVMAEQEYITICCLEKFLDKVRRNKAGGRADYVLIGPYPSLPDGSLKTCIVFLDLIVGWPGGTESPEKVYERKKKQLQESIELLCSEKEGGQDLASIHSRKPLPSVFAHFPDVQQHKVVAFIIPANYGQSRKNTSGEIIASHKDKRKTVKLFALNSDLFKGHITWQELLYHAGLSYK